MIVDAIASNDDTIAIRIGFSRADFANHLGVCDFFAAVSWYSIIFDDEEGVGAVDVFARGIRVGADALTEATNFICIQFVPNLVKLGVLSELAVL